MPAFQRVVFLPLVPGRKVDGLEFDVADNGRLDELVNRGWRIIQITAASNGVYALIERDGPTTQGTIPVLGPDARV